MLCHQVSANVERRRTEQSHSCMYASMKLASWTGVEQQTLYNTPAKARESQQARISSLERFTTQRTKPRVSKGSIAAGLSHPVPAPSARFVELLAGARAAAQQLFWVHAQALCSRTRAALGGPEHLLVGGCKHMFNRASWCMHLLGMRMSRGCTLLAAPGVGPAPNPSLPGKGQVIWEGGKGRVPKHRTTRQAGVCGDAPQGALRAQF